MKIYALQLSTERVSTSCFTTDCLVVYKMLECGKIVNWSASHDGCKVAAIAPVGSIWLTGPISHQHPDN